MAPGLVSALAVQRLRGLVGFVSTVSVASPGREAHRRQLSSSQSGGSSVFVQTSTLSSLSVSAVHLSVLTAATSTGTSLLPLLHIILPSLALLLFFLPLLCPSLAQTGRKLPEPRCALGTLHISKRRSRLSLLVLRPSLHNFNTATDYCCRRHTAASVWQRFRRSCLTTCKPAIQLGSQNTFE